eukprot:m.5777 g.5777  ORF g.5777 m.5777 type:complete len:437 (-) comp3395_c0_seq1:186-1496(-)
MSKYGNMRESNGFSKYLLEETLTEHDASMDHPFMKSVYERTFTPEAYVKYLASQLTIFQTMENLVQEQIKKDPKNPINDLFDPELNRTEAIREDMNFYKDIGWGMSEESGKSVMMYVALLREDTANSVECLLIHHLLQYLGILSGGQYLSQMISKRLDADNIAHENGKGVKLYKFPSLKASQMSKRVQAYMDKVDQLQLKSSHASLVECAKAIYQLILDNFEECHAVQASKLAAKPVEKETKKETGEDNDMKLTLEELKQYDGKKNKRIIFSIRKVLYDVTAGEAFYGPEGGYHMFAGHDCTKCLGSMNLGVDNLNDLSYEPTGKELETLKGWEEKLGAKYPKCGVLIGGTASGTSKSSTSSGKDQKAACPLSGATEGSCPFSAGSKDKEEQKECPWPFILLHDPARGLSAKYFLHNTAAAVMIVGCLIGSYFAAK